MEKIIIFWGKKVRRIETGLEILNLKCLLTLNISVNIITFVRLLRTRKALDSINLYMFL